LKLKDWVIGGRFFAAPWILVNTLFGAVLAGFHLGAWMLAFGTMLCLLTAAHYMNAWRDFARGVDTLQPEGSVAKVYTAASRLIPEGRMTTRCAEISALAFFLIAFAFFLLAPFRLDRALIFILGMAMALSYSDFWKPMGLPEPALFMGHGMATCTFAFALVQPLTVVGAAGGALLGLWAGFMTTIDQWIDIKKVEKARSLAELVFVSGIKISGLWWFIVTSSLVMQLGFVLIGWLPRGSLLTVFCLPLAHLAGIYLDADLDKGVLLGLLCMWLFAVFGSLGVMVL